MRLDCTGRHFAELEFGAEKRIVMFRALVG